MTVTLAQVAWKLGELAREGGVRYDAHDMSVMCSQMADAVAAQLTTPPEIPVSAGEAVALNAHKVIQDAIGFDFENRELQTVNEHDLLHLVDCVVKAVAPPPPAGFRMVPVDLVVPEGWVFYTADFSMMTSGRSKSGRVMLCRDESGKKWWLSLSEDRREVIDLYIYGYGETIQGAVDDAASRVTAAHDAGGV